MEGVECLFMGIVGVCAVAAVVVEGTFCDADLSGGTAVLVCVLCFKGRVFWVNEGVADVVFVLFNVARPVSFVSESRDEATAGVANGPFSCCRASKT